MGELRSGSLEAFFTPAAQLGSSELRRPEILVLHLSGGYITPVQLKQLIPISDIHTEEETRNFNKNEEEGLSEEDKLCSLV